MVTSMPAACSLASAPAAYQRVGIDGGDDAAGDFGCDKSVGARARAAVVAARFEGDVGGSAFGGEAAFCCLFQGDDFGVVALLVDVGAFSEDVVVANEDAADVRIW